MALAGLGYQTSLLRNLFQGLVTLLVKKCFLTPSLNMQFWYLEILKKHSLLIASFFFPFFTYIMSLHGSIYMAFRIHLKSFYNL